MTPLPNRIFLNPFRNTMKIAIGFRSSAGSNFHPGPARCSQVSVGRIIFGTGNSWVCHALFHMFFHMFFSYVSPQGKVGNHSEWWWYSNNCSMEGSKVREVWIVGCMADCLLQRSIELSGFIDVYCRSLSTINPCWRLVRPSSIHVGSVSDLLISMTGSLNVGMVPGASPGLNQPIHYLTVTCPAP